VRGPAARACRYDWPCHKDRRARHVTRLSREAFPTPLGTRDRIGSTHYPTTAGPCGHIGRGTGPRDVSRTPPRGLEGQGRALRRSRGGVRLGGPVRPPVPLRRVRRTTRHGLSTRRTEDSLPELMSASGCCRPADPELTDVDHEGAGEGAPGCHRPSTWTSSPAPAGLASLDAWRRAQDRCGRTRLASSPMDWTDPGFAGRCRHPVHRPPDRAHPASQCGRMTMSATRAEQRNADVNTVVDNMSGM
jgi:hypothetical protein